MSSSIVDAQTLHPVVVEQGKRLSRSMLWRLQRGFYEQSGVEAWNRGFVPHYITNNPFIAGAYARMTLGFLRDCLTVTRAEAALQTSVLDIDQPVYIVELGAGSGRFAYHYLKRLLPALEHSSLKGLRVVYVLTDLAQRNAAFWRQHPKLQPYFQSGQLDIACFDPIHEQEVRLQVSGTVLRPGELGNPLLVLANYFFDSLPLDVYSVRNGCLFEETPVLSSPAALLDQEDPAVLPNLSVRFEPRFAAPELYEDSDYNHILYQYQQILDRGYLLFPSGSFDCLRNLNRLSRNRVMLLSADKGFYRVEALRGQGMPEISRHGNAISMWVNFHALGQYIRLQGGQAYQAQHREEGLVINAFLLGSLPGNYGETRLAFQEAIEEHSPDDFFILKKAAEPHLAEFTFEQLLGLIRMSGYDAHIFAGCCPALMNRLETASLDQQQRMQEVARLVWEMYYPIGEPFDLPLALGKLFVALSCYPKALECLQGSPARDTDEEVRSLISVCEQHSWLTEDLSLLG